MPLKKGKKAVGSNVKELMHSFEKKGKIGTSKPKNKKAAQKQAVAIALNKSRENEEDPIEETFTNEFEKTYRMLMSQLSQSK